MTTSFRYTVLLPRLDHAGPANLAVDLAAAVAARGHHVQILCLSASSVTRSLPSGVTARRFRLSDLFRLHGVVHSHCLRPDLLAALLSLSRRRKTMTTLHNVFWVDLRFDHAPWKVDAAWWIWSRAIQLLTHRICISNAMRRTYERALPHTDFETIYNFRSIAERMLDAQVERVREWAQSRQREGTRVLCYVGSLSSRKNVTTLVEQVVVRDRTAVVLCGQGPLHSEIQQFVISCGANDKVLLLGQVSAPARVVELCDCLVLPSFAEGMPLAVLEAASVGRPSLLSRLAVHRELARLGIGSTFDHRQFADFDDVLQALVPVVGAPTNAVIQATWRDHFSPEVGIDAYLRLIEARGRVA